MGQLSPGVPWGLNSPPCTAHVYDWGLTFSPLQTALVQPCDHQWVFTRHLPWPGGLKTSQGPRSAQGFWAEAAVQQPSKELVASADFGPWAVGGGGCGEGPDGGGWLGGIHHLLFPWRDGFLCRDREELEEWPLGPGLPKAPIARPSLLLG